MDIVTQGLLGSSVALAGAKRTEIKQAAWIGCVAGLMADADVLIRSSTDPLLFLEFHRQFSHSLLFIPVGALIAASLVWVIIRIFSKPGLPFKRIYYYSFLGYMLSGLLDACTSYGTQLFWPFSNQRVAWSLVSIVDPIFTGVLIVALFMAIKMKLLIFVRFGLALCFVYLIFSSFQSKAASEIVARLAEDRGHHIERSIIKPTLGNVILWRSVYFSDGKYYIDAVNTLFGRKRYEGESIAAINIERGFPELDKSSVQYQDIIRFNYFSYGYLSAFPGQADVIGDVRYSVFPLSARSLWGIRINPDAQDSHIDFMTFREIDNHERSLFIDMVLGR